MTDGSATTVADAFSEVAELRRAEFPILRSWTYLDNATFGPVPRAHVRAASKAARQMSEKRIEEIGASATMEELRVGAATLLDCDKENVALLKSTSEGIGLIARGLEWQNGDEVILYDRDFPGTLAPWVQLEREGVVLRFVRDRGRARFDLAEVVKLISPRTRAICLSLVNSDHGFRAPIAELGELCKRRGIWLAVDAVQAVGTLDIHAEALNADIVAAHGYKFLLSGFGIGVSYCSPRAIEELRVPSLGWKNAIDVRPVEAETSSVGARRFEPTILSVPTMAGMRESLSLLAGVGMAAVETQILNLIDRIASALAERSYEVISSRIPAERSALLSFRHHSLDVEPLHAALLKQNVACAIRDRAIRISPHFYNTEEDVDRLLEALPK